MKKNTRYGPDLVGPAERKEKEKNKVTLGPHHGLRPRTMEQWASWHGAHDELRGEKGGPGEASEAGVLRTGELGLVLVHAGTRSGQQGGGDERHDSLEAEDAVATDSSFVKQGTEQQEEGSGGAEVSWRPDPAMQRGRRGPAALGMEPILRMETVRGTHPSSMAGELQEDGGGSLVRKRDGK